ncbi:MAG: NAD(P)/FAD-dependent oxidoreductase [Ilumatobacteraceae bacterium]
MVLSYNTPRPVVIGAGVVGCSIALELARRGHAPLVVDRGHAAGGGSTSASSAVVRFSYSTLDAVRLAWESKHLWDRWSDHLGVTDESGLARFIRTGLIILESPASRLSMVQEHFDLVGVPYEELTAAQLERRLPDLDVGRYWPPRALDDPSFWDDADGAPLGAYDTPDAGYVDDPALAAHNLMVAAQAHGAEFRFRTAVTGIHRDDRVRAVELADGSTVAASFAINAAGPHSSVLNRLAGLPDTGIRTRPLRQEVHVVPAPIGSTGPHEVAVSDSDLGTYMRPHLGGTFMIGGLEPECDPLVWVDDPDHFAEHPTVETWEAQTTRAARRLTSLRIPSAPAGLAALYDVSDDWMPVYDRSELPGWYMAIGTSGNQFKNAPMIGLLMTALIEACEAGHDHDHDPVVVHGPITGEPIDIGHFSRRRAVHTTTNSVLG